MLCASAGPALTGAGRLGGQLSICPASNGVRDVWSSRYKRPDNKFGGLALVSGR